MRSDHSFARWFRGAKASAAPSAPVKTAPRRVRRCPGLGELTRDLQGEEDCKPCVLDLGPTSPTNINFLIERNLRVYSEDLLRAASDSSWHTPQEGGQNGFEVDKFLAENLNYPDNHFDAILCWAVPDYLPEGLVKPVMTKLCAALKTRGTLLAFFHTKDAGSDSPFCRYHIVQPDMLELEPNPGFQIQRIFSSRHVENLFKDFATRKFFLGRDNIREVLVRR